VLCAAERDRTECVERQADGAGGKRGERGAAYLHQRHRLVRRLDWKSRRRPSRDPRQSRSVRERLRPELCRKQPHSLLRRRRCWSAPGASLDQRHSTGFMGEGSAGRDLYRFFDQSQTRRCRCWLYPGYSSHARASACHQEHVCCQSSSERSDGRLGQGSVHGFDRMEKVLAGPYKGPAR